MYEIKEEGYEYKGYKLGQMTDKGKIIGFDIYGCDCFIAINNNISKYDYNISKSDYVDIILKDFENYSFSWFNPNKLDCSATSEIITAISSIFVIDCPKSRNT